jgi:rhodanese-related sulfurtransferase
MIEAARKAVAKIPNDQLHAQLTAGASVVVIDVREREEWDDGHIPQGTLLPRGRLEGRAALAGQTLLAMGYTNVRYLSGGFNDWKAAGLPVEKPQPST